MTPTAADRIKANADRLRKKAAAPGSSPTSSDHQPSPLSPTTVVRQKNVRRTVDLSPTAHRALDGWQSSAAERLGLARVTGQDVLVALVDQLLADDELSDKIIGVLASRR